MACYNVMSILLSKRTKNAPQFQEILTKHGCQIKVRLGLHDAGDVCSEEGLIILQLCGNEAEIDALEKDLNSLDGVTAKNITLCSD